jgi:uncharacterized protein
MIIDMRLRPPTESWISKPQFVQGSPFYPTRIGFPRPQSAEKRSLPLLLKEMDEAGITYGVSMGRQSAEPLGCIPNEEMGTASRKIRTASSALPASTFAAAPTNALPKLNAAFPGAVSSACRSSLVPRTLPWRPTIVGLYPIYEACALRDVPVSVSLSGLLSTMVGASVEYSSPLPLYRVARDFPKLAIIISHAAWPWVQEVLGLAFVCPNIWVSPDLYINGTNMPFAAEFIKAANLYLADRLLFGTAYPSRPLVESVKAFHEWSFEPGEPTVER